MTAPLIAGAAAACANGPADLAAFAAAIGAACPLLLAAAARRLDRLTPRQRGELLRRLALAANGEDAAADRIGDAVAADNWVDAAVPDELTLMKRSMRHG